MTINTTISGILVDYSHYIFVHGKAPRGNGSWAYFLGDEAEPCFYNGSFAETRKMAVRDARNAGHWRVTLGS